MTKVLAVFLALVLVLTTHAQSTKKQVQLDYGDSEDDSGEDQYYNNYQQQYFSNGPQFNPFPNGGNSFQQQSFSSGPGFNQFFNTNGGQSSYFSNGNNVVVQRFGGPNNADETLIKVADPHIEITNGKVICKDLTCPTNTFKCVVTSKSNQANLQKLDTISECLDENGAVLLSGNTVDQNPYPNLQQPFTRHASADINGNVKTDDSLGNTLTHNAGRPLTPEESEKLNRELNEQQMIIQQNIMAQQKQLQEQLANQHRQMFEQQKIMHQNLNNIQANVQNTLRNVFANLPQFNNNFNGFNGYNRRR